MVSITCHGGINEIGGNKILVNFKKGSVFLDFGQSFKAEAEYFEEFLQPRSKSEYYDLTILGLLPRINGIYRHDAFCPNGLEACIPQAKQFWEPPLKSYEENKEKGWTPDAVWISHAHLDHSGYIGYLGNIPIICSEETKLLTKAINDVGNMSGFQSDILEMKPRILKNRSKNRGYFPESLYIDNDDPKPRTYPDFTAVKPYTTENEITITGFPVSHSVPGAMACLVEADDKQIFYTGDIRFHGRENPDLSNLDGLAPDVMIIEGTNIEDAEPDNEQKVQENIQNLISKTDELVMVGFAWKDLERYETVRDAAIKEGRIPVFDPRLAYTLARFGRDIYDEGASVFVERCQSMIYSEDDYTRSKHKAGLMDFKLWDSKNATRRTDTCHLEKGVYAYDLHNDPNAYVLHLDFYRFKNLLDIQPAAGSKYIRAQCEPFNPRMELSNERLHRWLKHFEINPDHDHRPYQFHASGHACGPDIIEFINRIKPKNVIPVHTEHPEAFKQLDMNVIIPEYGKEIKL